MTKSCLQLTVFSGHRIAGSSIGRARYRLGNGTPIFVDSMSVKSCSMYNSLPNVTAERANFTFLQYGTATAKGQMTVTIPSGSYTGDQLAVALSASMNAVLTQADANVVITYDALSRKVLFTFDNVHSYYYASTFEQYFVHIPEDQHIVWQFHTESGLVNLLSTFQKGSYLLDEWLLYCGQVLSADSNSFITVTNNAQFGQHAVTVTCLTPETALLLPGSNLTQSTFLGMDPQGMSLLSDSYTSSVPFPFSSQQNIRNGMSPILNFETGGFINEHAWSSGSISLAGDLYVHFKSNILGNDQHRSCVTSRDGTFFSMPVTASYTQLQSYEPHQRVSINYPGGIELSGFTIDLYNEWDERIEPTSDYVLELLISQTDVF
jgi:hypothetical protein